MIKLTWHDGDGASLWTEQYLLEAFLSFNSDFEILCALNYLAHKRPSQIASACPVLVERGCTVKPGFDLVPSQTKSVALARPELRRDQ